MKKKPITLPNWNNIVVDFVSNNKKYSEQKRKKNPQTLKRVLKNILKTPKLNIYSYPSLTLCYLFPKYLLPRLRDLIHRRCKICALRLDGLVLHCNRAEMRFGSEFFFCFRRKRSFFDKASGPSWLVRKKKERFVKCQFAVHIISSLQSDYLLVHVIFVGLY